MFYNVYSIFSFNEIDYLTYINLWMLFLYYWIITFFVVIVSSLLIRSSILFVNDSWLEFILTLFSLWLVLLIISPLFIMFIDYDSILLSSLLVYSLGYQWSWSFNLNGVFTYSLSDNYSFFAKNGLTTHSFVIASLRDALAACGGSGSESLTFGQRPNSLDFIGYCLYSSLSNFLSLSYSSNSSFEYVSINVSFDHFLVPTLSDLILLPLRAPYCLSFSAHSDGAYFPLLSGSRVMAAFLRGALACNASSPVHYELTLFSYCSFSELTLFSFLFDSFSLSSYLVYFISLNSILLLPCFLGFRFLIFSFDVIHSLGFYSLGFKMDAIPGRINYSFELSTFFKGEHRGFCYELCGTSHSSMLILAVSL